MAPSGWVPQGVGLRLDGNANALYLGDRWTDMRSNPLESFDAAAVSDVRINLSPLAKAQPFGERAFFFASASGCAKTCLTDTAAIGVHIADLAVVVVLLALVMLWVGNMFSATTILPASGFTIIRLGLL